MNFDNSLPDKCGSEELPKGNTKVPTCDACQVKKRIRNRCAQENRDESIPLQVVEDHNLCLVHQALILFSFQHMDLVDLVRLLQQLFSFLLVLLRFQLHFHQLLIRICCFFRHEIRRKLA